MFRKSPKACRALFTELFEHFVALVKDEMLEILAGKFLRLHESENSARGPHQDARTVGFQNLLVFSDRQPTKKYANLFYGFIYKSTYVVSSNEDLL